MNTFTRVEELNLLPKDNARTKRLLTMIMLPAMVFYMSSLNILMGGLMTASASAAVPVQLTIASPTITVSKVYDGDTIAAVTAGALSGVDSNDTVTVSAEANYDNANVGTGKTITVVYTLGGAAAVNYTKPVNDTVATGEITAKEITVTPTAGQSKVYGAADPASFAYTSTDNVATGDLARVGGGDVGNYAYTKGTVTVGSNYTMTLAPQTFAVNPVPAANLVLTVQAATTITRSALVPETSGGTPTGGNAAVAAAIVGLTAIPVTLQNTGDAASANVRISPIGNASGHIQLWAKDSAHNWTDINVTGYIDSAGIAVPASYSKTTDVYVLSDVAGSYPLTVSLVNVSNSSSAATPVTGTVTVVPITHTQADFKAFDGVNIGTNSYAVSSGITSTYDNGTGTVDDPFKLKLTGYAPIVTPWFHQDWVTYNYVTIGIRLPANFVGIPITGGTAVYSTGVSFDDGISYDMGSGSTPLATAGGALHYLDFSFGANKSYVKNGLVKLEVIWNANSAPEYYTIDVNGLQLDPVFNDKNKNGTFNSGEPSFNTIQAAIDATSTIDGDTIIVGAGTYNENQIIINKAITIQGAGADTTFIDGGAVSLSTDGLVRITANGNVKFDGFTVRKAGGPDKGAFKVRVGVYAESSDAGATYTVSNNNIYGTNDADEEEDYGFYANGGQESIVFSHNTITQTGGNAVLVENNPGAVEISSNTLDEGVYGSTAVFVMTHGTDVITLQKVAGNTINAGTGNFVYDPSNPWTSGGITFSSAYKGATGTFTNVQITGNEITNLKGYRRGISLVNDAESDGTAGNINVPVITGNTITGTGGTNSIGIQLYGLVTNANIQNNLISGVSNRFYKATGSYGAHNPVVSTVYVDTAYVDVNGSEGGHMSGYNAFTTIQAGISAVAPDGTVHVAAGDYTENLTINNPVHLLGPNADIDPNTGTPVSAATITGQVTDYAGNTDIKGFTITNPSYSDATIKGVFVFSAGSVISNITIENNIFSNITNVQAHGSYGVMVQGVTSGVNILNNKFDGITATVAGGWAHAIEVTPTGSSAIVPQNTTITGNVISNVTNPSQSDAYAFSVDSAGVILADASQVTFNHNSLLGNVRNLDTNHTLDATNNWWGSASPVFATIVSSGVSYTPWCINDTCSAFTSGTEVTSTFTDLASETTATPAGNVTVDMPANLVVTGPAGWDGTTIHSPTVIVTDVAPTPDSDNNVTVVGSIEVGFDDMHLTFNQAVKLTFAGQAGKFVGWSQSGVFHQITNVCADDSQATGDALAADTECKINDGSDLVVWTKHFSTFTTYTQFAAQPSAPTVVATSKTTVTLTANSLNQFSKDSGVNWQDSNVFTGLKAGTTYTFVTKVMATATVGESVASAGTVTKTDKNSSSSNNNHKPKKKKASATVVQKKLTEFATFQAPAHQAAFRTVSAIQKTNPTRFRAMQAAYKKYVTVSGQLKPGTPVGIQATLKLLQSYNGYSIYLKYLGKK